MPDDVFLTGATGLLGNAIARVLVSQGRKVRALVRNTHKAKDIVPAACELVAGDITDAASVVAGARGTSVVYHAAGLPEQWLADVRDFDRVNVDGTRNVVSAAETIGATRFVYASTIDVFRFSPPGIPFDESELDPVPKATAYERSKQAADRLVAAAVATGLPAVFLHPSGIYGPGPLTSPGTNHLIADLVRGKVPMLLPGAIPVVYSDDVALGHVLAETKAAVGARYILSESTHSLTAIAEAVRAATSANGKPSKVPPVMPIAIAKVVASVGEFVSGFTKKPPLLPKGQLEFLQYGAMPSGAKAMRELDWKPRSFEQGVAQTLAFLREHGRI
ncbi:MAG TPA: NAD-dependent epimerase/dehydratase family protein [Candidatus Limnocylindrales bacterium]|nr:NAD-dependent epimerase/dehydratase family protein [Candidatus Limnocylindrales bacterium]